MDRVDEIAGLREEGILQFVGWCYPVSCPDNNRRCVEFIEPQLRDFRRFVAKWRFEKLKN